MIINTFWTNSIWYIILLLFSIALFSFALYKSKTRKRDLGFFCAVMGLTFLVETVVYLFLRGYEYYPRIILNSPQHDSVIGNMISQFSISTIALLISMFNISFSGVVLAGAIFYLTEKLFLSLGIFQHFWYKSWITFVGITVLIEFIKKWYKAVVKANGRADYYFTIILGVLSLYLPTTNWIGILSGYVVFKGNIFMDPLISHAIIAIPKYFIHINLVYFASRKKTGWLWNAAAAVTVLASDAILYYSKIIYIKEGWLFVYSGLSLLSIYFYVYLMRKLLYGNRRYKA